MKKIVVSPRKPRFSPSYERTW